MSFDYKKVPWEVWAIGGGLLAMFVASKIWSAKDVGTAAGSTAAQVTTGVIGGVWEGLLGIVDGIGNSLNETFATSNGQNALNPANPENPINSIVSNFYDPTGQHTIGGDIYDLFHGNWSELTK